MTKRGASLALWMGMCVLMACVEVALGSRELTQTSANVTPGWKFTAMHHFDNVPLTPNALLRASDGNFYGTTADGGPDDSGAILKITPAGALTVLHWFTRGDDGADPFGRLIQASDGNFYGTTDRGGASGVGVIFKVTPAGALTTLHSFSSATGYFPRAGVIQASDGHFYGTTIAGGAASFGTIYRMTSDGTVTVLHSFSGGAGGESSTVELVEGTDLNLYGTTSGGGTASKGTVFRITPGGSFAVLHSFAGGDGGQYPGAPLIQAADGNFYGSTTSAGASGLGTIFKMTPAGVVTIVYAFAGGSDGARPEAPLLQASDGNFYGTTTLGGAAVAGNVFKMTAAGVVSTVYSFPSLSQERSPGGLIQIGQDLYGTTSRSSNSGGGAFFKVTTAGAYSLLRTFPQRTGGSTPRAPLIQATNGLLYGTTFYGGSSNIGTIFSMTTAGALTSLLTFDSSVSLVGMYPETGVMQAADGHLYATTQQFRRICLGGPCPPSGTASRVTTAGAQTYLHYFDFDEPEGSGPAGPLVQGTDGNFYGTTGYDSANGQGSAFRMAPDGTVTVLHAFDDADGFGTSPRSGLIRGTDGNYYGTTSGYPFGGSTVFRMTPAGTMTLLHTFNGDNGYEPRGELVQATDGAFYGTTIRGGDHNKGVAYKITSGGTFTLLHHFGVSGDGAAPYGALVQASDGKLYGTTSAGGAWNHGTIFSMTTTGLAAVLHSFTGADGSRPRAGLVLASNGRFYGTAAEGGASASGVVFRLQPIAPFTDNALTASVSVIRALHITELRTRINAVRSALGLGAYAYEDPALAAGGLVRAQHIQDLRAALQQAYAAAGQTPPVYTDPGVTAGMIAKAVHIAELRLAVIALE